MSDLIHHEQSVMDEIEESAADPREDFPHNYLTPEDQRRAETRRRLEFPGLYPASGAENDETELKSCPSKVADAAANAARARLAAVNDAVNAVIDNNAAADAARARLAAVVHSKVTTGAGAKPTKSGVSKYQDKNDKLKSFSRSAGATQPMISDTEVEEGSKRIANDAEAEVEADCNKNNCNNGRSLTSSPDDEYHYDHDYRQYDGQYRSEATSQTEADTVETAVSTTTITKRHKVRASSPFDDSKINKIRRTKTNLKRSRRKSKRKPTVDELLASSFRSDNANAPGIFHVFKDNILSNISFRLSTCIRMSFICIFNSFNNCMYFIIF